MENLVNKDFLSQTYHNKKVLVTGHTGFKGSWLCQWLILLGAEVKGYALAPEYPINHFDILELDKKMNSVIADIRDKDTLLKEVLEFQPDFIFHLAAQPLVRRSYRIPSETFEVNVVGTANLLEALIKVEKKCAVIVVTTDKVYENIESDVLYKESDRLGGYDPYSASKACTELVVDSFRNSFFSIDNFEQHQKIIGAARAGNVIGGGDFSEDRLIPDIIRSLENNDRILIRNPNAIRPWQHVLEPLGGYLLWAARLYNDGIGFSGALNFGPQSNDHLKVFEVVDQAVEKMKKGSWFTEQNDNLLHEAGILKLDISKVKTLLHWEPKMNANKAIELTMNWYAMDAKERAQATISQILNYMAS